MAPIEDGTARSLADTVQKLEAKVKELEYKIDSLQGGSSKSSPSSQEVRMILMGPPGAGMCFQLPMEPFYRSPDQRLTQWPTGKGTQAPNIKERFSCCHLVRSPLKGDF